MRVTSFVSYCAYPVSADEKYAANFVRSVKRRGGLCDRNTDAVEWFGKMSSIVISAKRLQGPLVVVPIPDSGCSVRSNCPPLTLALAEAVVTHGKPATVVDALRWIRPMKPSHSGGDRKPQVLFDHLVLTCSLPQGSVVVVDDVVTTGGHVLAAAAALSTVRRHCSLALCLAKSSKTACQAFGISETFLSDFHPRESCLSSSKRIPTFEPILSNS